MLPLHHAPKCRRYYTPILRSCQFFLDDFSNFRCQSCIIKKGQSGRASPGKRDVKLWGGEDGSRKGSIGGDGRARGNDFCGFALEGWPFCRLYGIVMVLRRGMEVENGRNEARLRCTALAGAGAIYFGGHISPDGSRDGVATVCHLLFIDEFHLYWHGDGVGVFHFAANSASARAEMATVGMRNDGALAIFARGEVSFFRGGCHYPAAMVFILCSADSCAAFQRICRLAAGAEGGCAVFRPLVFSVHTSGAADWRGFDE